MVDGLTITEWSGFGLATIMARKGVAPSSIGLALSMSAPEAPRLSAGSGISLIGTGPSTWLALTEKASPNWVETLREKLWPFASVSDQSGAYTLLRLSGTRARTLLQRGASIDFHPLSFAPDSVATTVIGHIGVILWQVDEMPTYNLAVFRSFGGSLHHWIEQTVRAL